MRFLLALTLCLLPFAALAQSDDRDMLTRFLETNLSGAGREVTITGFRGALSSRATIETMTIADGQGIWLTLEGVVLDWNRLAVLSGNIQINELTASTIALDRMPVADPSALPSTAARGFALPALPVAVQIGRIAATRVTLGPTVLGQPVIGTLEASLTLAGGEGRGTLGITRMDDGPSGRVDLAGSFANASGQLVIDLEAAEGAGGIAATLLGLPGEPAVRLAVQGAGPITGFAATLALETDGVERLAGQVTLRGTAPGETRFTADLGGDPAPLFLPDYAAFFGPEVRLRTNGRRDAEGGLALSDFSLTARSLTLAGALELAPDGLPQRAALTGRLADPDGTPVLLPMPGETRTRVQSADLSLAFDRALGDDWTLGAQISGLTRPGTTIDRLVLDGAGTLSGGDAAAFAGRIDYAAEGLAPADPALAAALGPRIAGAAALTWRAGDGGVTLDRMTLAGADYDLAAEGRITGLATGFGLAGTARLTGSDLSRFAALAGRPVSGAATLAVEGAGSPLGGSFDIRLAGQGTDLAIGQAEFDALMRGPSTLSIDVARDVTGTTLRALSLTAGQGRVTAQGRIASAGSALTGRVDLPSLAVLGPGYGGTLAADAGFSGTLADAKLTLRGTGSDLAIAGQPQVSGMLAGQTALDVALALRGDRVVIDRAALSNPQGTAVIAGAYDPAGSDLTAKLNLQSLAALGPGYRGALVADAAFTGTPGDGAITLDGTARDLRIGQPEVDRILAGTSTLSLRLGVVDRRVTVETARLTNPQIAASATGSLTDRLRRVTVDARLANLALLIPEFPGPLTVAGDLVDDGTGYGVDLRLTGPGQINATTTGRMSLRFDRADLAIRGTAQAALANVFLGSRAISGPVSFDLALNGRPGLSALSGSVRLAGGRLSDPGLRFSLADIGAEARLAGGVAQVQATAAVSSGGTVTVAGPVRLTAPYPATLEIGLRQVVLRDPQLYRTKLNGTLALSGPVAAPLVTGRIDLEETELRVPSTGLGGGALLTDLQHVNEPPAVRATRARAGLLGEPAGAQGVGGNGQATLDLVISAPDRVFLRGRGLDAELGGRIVLRGPVTAIRPEGAMELIRGRLDILGKRLVLTSARLDLQGDLIPTINVVATNVGNGVTTSVEIDGRADAPTIRFTSSPELPEEEVLAQLLFGKGIENISALQAAQLAGAVASLAGRGGDGIVGRLRKGFGLDDLDLQTDAEGGATLRAGKYLSENVYSEVEVDGSGNSQINLNLDLRRGLTVRGSVDNDANAGIGLFLERNY